MAESGEGTAVRLLHPVMRWLLFAASALVALAGFQLFVLSEQTGTTFAWTVKSYLTAATLGAAYWSAVPVEFLAARQKDWAKARIAVPGVWVFTTLTLVLTILHADLFHFSSPDLVPRAAAYLWLGIYAGVPVAMLAALFLQRRGPGVDPPKEHPLPAWMKVWLLIEGGALLVLGVALFAVPDAVRPSWPWTLTTLTARAVGAWFVGFGVILVHSAREDDLTRIRPMGGGVLVFGILGLVAIARNAGEVAWSAPAAWSYLVFLASLMSIGVIASFEPGIRDRIRRT